MNYVIWKYDHVEGACSLLEPTGIDSMVPLKEGEPIASGISGSGLSSAMNPESPDDLMLLDNVHNTDGILVASPRLRAFLGERNLADVEYLPISILDHKGRVAAPDYFVIHPVAPVDAIDADASLCKMSRIKKDRIQSMKKLALRPDAIPADRKLFRLKGLWNVALVSRPVADAISAAGFSGIRWLELSAYPES
jgi:hypothetical protein